MFCKGQGIGKEHLEEQTTCGRVHCPSRWTENRPDRPYRTPKTDLNVSAYLATTIQCYKTAQFSAKCDLKNEIFSAKNLEILKPLKPINRN